MGGYSKETLDNEYWFASGGAVCLVRGCRQIGKAGIPADRERDVGPT